jgi:hypothetical protein
MAPRDLLFSADHGADQRRRPYGRHDGSLESCCDDKNDTRKHQPPPINPFDSIPDVV